MFTKNQIQEAFGKVKSGADFPQLVQDLKVIGVTHYENFVEDGKTIFHGENNFTLINEPKYPALKLNETGSVEKLKHALLIHQKGQTDYLTFCKDAADAGVEKWITHMLQMTVAYSDKKGNVLVVEDIPQVN